MADIIDLKSHDIDLKSITVRAKRRRYAGRDRCRHLQVLLDESTGMVNCQRCKQPLSAFKWLLDMASRHEDLIWRHQDLKRKIEEEKATLQELERLERNTRARLQRLGEGPL